MTKKNKLKNKRPITFMAVMAFMFTAVIGLGSKYVFAAIPEPMPNLFVHDFANVLTEDTRQMIINRGVALAEIGDAQVVVVTVDFTDGMGVEDFAVSLFNEWGIGSSRADNGLLMLLAIQEDDYWVEPGYDFPSIISMGTLDSIIMDQLEPSFDAGNFDAGVRLAFTEIMDRVDDYFVQLNQTNTVITPTQGDVQTMAPMIIETQPSGVRFGDIVSIMFIVVLLLVFMSVMSGGRRRRMGMGGGFGSSMMWWMMPSPFRRRGRTRTIHHHHHHNVPKPPTGGIGRPSSGGTPTPRYRGNSTAFGGGRSGGGGLGRGGAGRSFGGGRSGGGGIGRRR